MRLILSVFLALVIPTETYGKVTAVVTQTGDSIPSIRQRYAAINKGVRKYRTVKKELSGFSLEGGELVAYFDGPRIVKITAQYFGESGRAMEEYYYWNEKLIFVFRQEHTYDTPMSGKIVSTQTNRLYFSNDRLIRWIDENGNANSTGSDPYHVKQQEFLETSNKFLRAARSTEPTIEARMDEVRSTNKYFSARS